MFNNYVHNTTKQERIVWTEINLALGKNGDHKPSGLGSRSILQSGKQAARQACIHVARQQGCAQPYRSGSYIMGFNPQNL